MASANGYNIKNEVSCKIKFKEPLDFNAANFKLIPLLSIFSLIAGTKINIVSYNIHAFSENEEKNTFEVYQSFNKNHKKNMHDIHPSQRLIAPESQPEKFQHIVTHWLERQNDWQDARWQFFGSFTDENYSTDRLIKVANMFDLIPDTAYGGKIELSEELKIAKKTCRDIFKILPKSNEKDSILNALGRLGTKSLKHKINIRAQIVLNSISSEYLPNIDLVINNCVDCRNHFVHGGTRRFDYLNNFNTVIYFTDTLEFIYGLSELIDCGWEFYDWWKKTPMNHPFFDYIKSYRKNLSDLEKLLVAGK